MLGLENLATDTSWKQLATAPAQFEPLENRVMLVASLSIDDPSVTEGDVSSVNLDFTVTRSDTLSDITVSYATSDNSPAAGAATAGVDYTATANGSIEASLDLVRGKGRFSRITTRRPCSARMVAAAVPAGPAPMTTAS